MSEYEPLRNGPEAASEQQYEDAAEPFPWPPAEHESILSAFGRTWQGASLQPRAFFARMPAQGSLIGAVLYYLAIGIAAAGALLFFRMVQGPPEEPDGGILGELGMAGEWNPLLDFLLSPLLLLLSLVLASAVVHLMLKIFGGASRPYAFTVRTFAYAYSPQILGIVPYLGTFVGFIWMTVVAIIGLSAGHRTSTGRAAAAVLVPLIIALGFVMFALFFATVIAAGSGILA